MTKSNSGYHDNIEKATKKNDTFRTVLYTGSHLQLVVMSLKPGEEIGVEVHDNVDQFFRVESGKGTLVMSGNVVNIKDDHAFIVPAGVEHNVINNGKKDLKLYTIYAPANHPEGTIHQTKEEAEAAELAMGHH